MVFLVPGRVLVLNYLFIFYKLLPLLLIPDKPKSNIF